jgi:hypothetical protein
MNKYIYVIIDEEGDVNCAAETKERAQQIIDEADGEGEFDYVKAMYFKARKQDDEQ